MSEENTFHHCINPFRHLPLETRFVLKKKRKVGNELIIGTMNRYNRMFICKQILAFRYRLLWLLLLTTVAVFFYHIQKEEGKK